MRLINHDQHNTLRFGKKGTIILFFDLQTRELLAKEVTTMSSHHISVTLMFLILDFNECLHLEKSFW